MKKTTLLILILVVIALVISIISLVSIENLTNLLRRENVIPNPSPSTSTPTKNTFVYPNYQTTNLTVEGNNTIIMKIENEAKFWNYTGDVRINIVYVDEFANWTDCGVAPQYNQAEYLGTINFTVSVVLNPNKPTYLTVNYPHPLVLNYPIGPPLYQVYCWGNSASDYPNTLEVWGGELP